MNFKQMAAAAVGLPLGILIVYRLETTDAVTIAMCMVFALALSSIVVEVLFRLFPLKPRDTNQKNSR